MKNWVSQITSAFCSTSVFTCKMTMIIHFFLKFLKDFSIHAWFSFFSSQYFNFFLFEICYHCSTFLNILQNLPNYHSNCHYCNNCLHYFLSSPQVFLIDIAKSHGVWLFTSVVKDFSGLIFNKHQVFQTKFTSLHRSQIDV